MSARLSSYDLSLTLADLLDRHFYAARSVVPDDSVDSEFFVDTDSDQRFQVTVTEVKP